MHHIVLGFNDRPSIYGGSYFFWERVPIVLQHFPQSSRIPGGFGPVKSRARRLIWNRSPRTRLQLGRKSGLGVADWMGWIGQLDGVLG